MGSYSNARKMWLRFLMGKTFMFFILFSFIITLNVRKPDESANQKGIKPHYKLASAQITKMPSPDAVPLGSVLSDQKVLAAKFSIKIQLTPRQKKNSKKYQHLILEAAARYEVEPEIIKAIILAESGFNPKAVSKVGARGLMQLMPRTAKVLGVKDIFKPDLNIDAGVRYFKQLLDKFDGEKKLALAAYNAGSYNVRKYKGVPPFKATQIYIDKVLKYYQAYQMI